MKSIKICEENSAAIEAALVATNGKSEAHAFTTFGEVLKEKDYAEKTVGDLLNKKEAIGARLITTSGRSVARAYKYSRQGTMLTMVCKSSGWHLEAVSQVSLRASGGSRQIVLTVAQAEQATARFQKNWVVA